MTKRLILFSAFLVFCVAGIALALPTNPTGNQVSVTATATLIRQTSTTIVPFNYSIVITNIGPNPIYVGFANTVTTANAPIYIPVGSAFTLNNSYPATIYGICGSGLTSTVSWMEEVTPK
jgi:hypothetical protein